MNPQEQTYSFENAVAKVYESETLRSGKHYNDALSLLSPVLQTLLDKLTQKQVTAEEQTLILMAANILVSTNLSLARASERGPDVLSQLELAKRIISETYFNQQLIDHAAITNNELLGKPYDFPSEMLRNEANYYIVAALLFDGSSPNRDDNFLRLAAQLFYTIANNSPEPTAKTIAAFERAKLMPKIFPDNPEASLQRISLRALEAVNASVEHKNFDRAMTVAAANFAETLALLPRVPLRGSVEIVHALGSILYVYAKNATARFGLQRTKILDTAKSFGTLFKINFTELGKRFIQDHRARLWKETLPEDADVETFRLRSRQESE